MNSMIDLNPYLPAPVVRPVRRHSVLRTLLLALESLVTAVIGVCMLIGTLVFFLMLF